MGEPSFLSDKFVCFTPPKDLGSIREFEFAAIQCWGKKFSATVLLLLLLHILYNVLHFHNLQLIQNCCHFLIQDRRERYAKVRGFQLCHLEIKWCISVPLVSWFVFISWTQHLLSKHQVDLLKLVHEIKLH